MCLAVPGLIVEKFDRDGLMMAKIDFGGLRREICLEYTKEAKTGDYVLVHVGFAINIINQDEAEATLKMLKDTDDP